MIELSPTTAFMVYLGLTIVFLLGIWVLHHYQSRHRRFLPMEQDLNVCEFCHFAYLDTGAKKITKCPRCQSFNTNKVN